MSPTSSNDPVKKDISLTAKNSLAGQLKTHAQNFSVSGLDNFQSATDVMKVTENDDTTHVQDENAKNRGTITTNNSAAQVHKNVSMTDCRDKDKDELLQDRLLEVGSVQQEDEDRASGGKPFQGATNS